MTGLEVLGVVIGGLPMVIGSAQASKQACTRSSSPKERELQDVLGSIIDTLKRQHYFLRSDLETILTSQSDTLESAKVAEILHQPHANYFRDAQVQRAVRMCLGDGYEVYVSTVSKCGEGIFALTERLAGLKVPVKKGFGRQSVSKSQDFERVLERLDAAAVLLGRLRVGKPTPGIRSADGALSRSGSVRDSRVRMFGHKADLLYGVMLGGYRGCHPAHPTALWLPTGEGRDILRVGFETGGYAPVDVRVSSPR